MRMFKQTKIGNSKFYKTHFYRFIQTPERRGAKLVQTFIDETGKLTKVRYGLIGISKNNKTQLITYNWRLDARSIRYMKRKAIIENVEKEK